jgi:predicted TIM-barrel fold metal-dependent hydrolase
MATRADIVVNPENEWRIETPGVQGWEGSVRPGAPNKYLMISVDTHMSPPPTLFRERIAEEYRDRLPYIHAKDGKKWLHQEGLRPQQIFEPPLSGEDIVRSKAGGFTITEFIWDYDGQEATWNGPVRIQDQEMDGVDGEVIFPNGPALLMWGSSDARFVQAQCRIWNDWVMETCGPYLARMNPVAALAPADLEGSIAEVKRVADLGFRAVTLPSKPIWGARDIAHVNYNLPHFDPLWEVLEDLDLAVTFHVSTGMDPRAARGHGGAVINYVVHSMAPTIEPLVSLCASGVFERFPRLRAGTIEANAGWLPFVLDAMDEAYRKHHFWVRPKLANLPSDYFRSNCFASVSEDPSSLLLAERYRLQDNLLWANDYPHHEGTWPHSAEAIERTFGEHLGEQTRRKILGLNAARIFRFDIPQQYR